jgi:farnesyl-diphosphate farnesyltransferase
VPEPTRSQVSIAYLLFRIADTFEDATRWTPARRIQALGEFEELLEDPDRNKATQLSERWLADPPVDHAGYLELLAGAPRVLRWYRELRPDAVRELIARHARESARGMAAFLLRSDAQGRLQLDTLQQLRGYCFVVAGVVGEMLTELFLMDRRELAPIRGELRRRAATVGEALQLINILKDASADAAMGRVYLPRDADLAEIFALAHADLQVASEYNELLRRSGARGIWAFNALNTRLGIETLKLLQGRGAGAKLGRHEVGMLRAQILRAMESDVPVPGAVST